MATATKTLKAAFQFAHMKSQLNVTMSVLSTRLLLVALTQALSFQAISVAHQLLSRHSETMWLILLDQKAVVLLFTQTLLANRSYVMKVVTLQLTSVKEQGSLLCSQLRG